ncbi:MAG: O-antigen ligase family protein [Patescibacteria group bacterium]
MTISLNQVREYGFYLLVFILPWQTRWIIRDPLIGGEVWEYGRVSLYGWDIVLIVLLLISLLAVGQMVKNFKFLIFNFKSNFKWSFKIFKNPVLVYLLLLLFTFTSIGWAGDKVLTLYWLGRIAEVGALWWLIKFIKPRLSVVCWSLVAAGTVQALWAIGQFITQSTFASKWLGVAVHPITQYGTSVVLTDAGRWLRAYAGQVHPNVLGGLLVVTCLATILLISRIKNYELRIKNIILVALYIIQLVGLFFTFSRGAWLALFITLAVLIMYNCVKYVRPDIFCQDDDQMGLRLGRHYLKKRLAVVLGYTLLVFITLGVVLWQPTVGRILGYSRLEVKSVEERMASVQDSQKVAAVNQWFGVGLGNYTVALQKIMPNERAYYYQPVHNVFLLILAELGIIGLLLFMWLIGSMVCLKKPLAISHWLLAAVLITSLFDHYWWTIPSMLVLGGLWLSLSQARLEP